MAVSDEDAQLIERALLAGSVSLQSNEVLIRLPVDSDLLKAVQSLAEKEGRDYLSFIQKILAEFIIQQRSNSQEGGSNLKKEESESRRKAA